MKSLKRLQIRDAPADIIAEIEEAGAVIIEGFLSEETVERFNDDINPVLERQVIAQACVNDAVTFFHGPQTRHLTSVAKHSGVFINEILLHPVYQAVGNHFLLPACHAWHLNLAHVLDRGPGSGDQLLHRDHDVWPRALSAAAAHRQFASLVALTEYSADMGATRIVPGSHNWEISRIPRPEDIAVAEMSKGSAVIYLGSTLHGAGANVTDKRRVGMHVSFCLGWLRTEENMNLAIPLDRVRTMPRRAQELLGFGIHDGAAVGEGFLGAVDNSNPIDLMTQGRL
jgi:ectoine hydroxylase-related dioxygenase (phytanoyl-CoA dioxygenase family)